jgi:hypothetical protein
MLFSILASAKHTFRERLGLDSQIFRLPDLIISVRANLEAVMGNTQPQTVDGVPIKSVEQDGHEQFTSQADVQTGGRVRIAGPKIDVEKAIQEAYEKGRAEGQASVKGMLEAVAADVYDNIHTQLTDIQTKQVQEAQKMVSYFVLIICSFLLIPLIIYNVRIGCCPMMLVTFANHALYMCHRLMSCKVRSRVSR